MYVWSLKTIILKQNYIIILIGDWASTGIYVVANPARAQLNRNNKVFSLPPFTPEKLVSQDGFGRPVPRQFALLPRPTESGSDNVITPTCYSHFISIVGVGKRGAYYLVHGDLLRQHSFGTTLRFTGPVPDSRQ